MRYNLTDFFLHLQFVKFKCLFKYVFTKIIFLNLIVSLKCSIKYIFQCFFCRKIQNMAKDLEVGNQETANIKKPLVTLFLTLKRNRLFYYSRNYLVRWLICCPH